MVCEAPRHRRIIRAHRRGAESSLHMRHSGLDTAERGRMAEDIVDAHTVDTQMIDEGLYGFT